MSRWTRVAGTVLVVSGLLGVRLFAASAAPTEVTIHAIPFEDINASGKPITSCWGGVGMDAQQRVYIAMGIGAPESDDVAVFHYDTRTGQRRFLTTLKAITVQEGNDDPRETFAKVHAEIQAFGGKMYFATHDFHDTFAGTYHRGGHFFAYDPATETFEDLSKHEPGGVSAPGQGLIGMALVQRQQQLVGFTFPAGDVVVHDLRQQQSVLWPAVPHEGGVSRHLFTTEDGIAFITYGDSGPQPIYAMNLATGETVDSGVQVRTAQIPALAHAADGHTIYLLNWDFVYRFDARTYQWEPLGEMAAPADVGVGLAGANLVRSTDGQTLYATLEGYPHGTGAYTARLYAFDLQTRQASLVADVTEQILRIGVNGLTGTLIGAVMDDHNRLYLCGSEGYLMQYSPMPTAPPRAPVSPTSGK